MLFNHGCTATEMLHRTVRHNRTRCCVPVGVVGHRTRVADHWHSGLRQTHSTRGGSSRMPHLDDGGQSYRASMPLTTRFSET